MTKRPITFIDQSIQSPQKARRTEDGSANTDTEGPEMVLSPLMTRLTHMIFGDRPRKVELCAMDYMEALVSSSTPTPKTSDYLAFMKAACPTQSGKNVARAWNTIKRRLGDAKKHDFPDEDHLGNMDTLITALNEVPEIDASVARTAMTDEAAISLPLPSSSSSSSSSSPLKTATPKVVSSSRRSSKTTISRSSFSCGSSNNSGNSSNSGDSSSNSGNTSSSGDSSSHPSASQIIEMKALFKDNFRQFQGAPWSLSSGTVIDDRLLEAITDMSHESILHSFVIKDVDAVLALFEAEDQEEIASTMVARQDKGLLELSEDELGFLAQFNMPRDELVEFMADHSWRSVGTSLENKPSTEFQKVAYSCVAHVLGTYEKYGFSLPNTPLESWCTHGLWGFLNSALHQYQVLEYTPGEVHSEASAHRQQKQRSRQGRRQVGHKVDGMVGLPARSLEILYVEADKKDSGAKSTKCSHDIRKLCKLMKDAHDAIRERTTANVREEVKTFGLRISGTSATVLTLHQLPGRFYQAIPEVDMSFPGVWTQHDTQTITSVITWILRLRKTILAMAERIFKWTSEPKSSQRSKDHDHMAPTMTSPQLVPTFLTTVNEDIPPLE
ncbi:hypothetical protein BGX34_002287 [Mortierella sp. NVP85]|nr:hypothetical protein BGX34_002287 [Mortierella sp. NVP85]